MFRLTISIIAVLLLINLSAKAQVYSGDGYTGPKLFTSEELVEQAQSLEDSTQLVRLQGTICLSDDGTHFQLVDDSGETTLVIDDSDWPYKPMDENTIFVVYGDLLKSSDSPVMLDVKKMFVLK